MNARSSVDALVELVNDLEAENRDLVTIRSEAVALDGRDINIEVDVRLGPTTHSSWRLTGHEMIEHSFVLEAHHNISLHSDHVLLLDHLDRRAQVYFRGPAPDPVMAVGSLAVAHDRVVGAWRPFSRYLNHAFSLPELLSQPSGKLAEGPARVLAAYVAALDQLGFSTTTIDAGAAKYWDDERHWVGTGEVVAMVPRGSADSYVIANDFSASRIG